MKAWLRKIGLGLKVAEKVAVLAGQAGLTIQGRNPAEIDAIAHVGADAIVKALKKKPALVVPAGSPGD